MWWPTNAVANVWRRPGSDLDIRHFVFSVPAGRRLSRRSCENADDELNAGDVTVYDLERIILTGEIVERQSAGYAVKPSTAPLPRAY